MTDYLSRMGSIIVILTLLFVALILATQFSFGRFFSFCLQHGGQRRQSARRRPRRRWLEDRRRARERREVIAKHVKKGTASPEAIKAATERAARPEPAAPPVRSKPVRPVDDEERDEPAVVAPIASMGRPTPPVVQKRAKPPVAPPLPLPDPEPLSRGLAERRLSGYTLPPRVAARSATRPSARSTSAS